jgi:protocatechuate 3,4-dioxygenase beta subunit
VTYLLLLGTLTGLTGTVLDEKNRPIAGAVVVLMSSSIGGDPRTGTADAEGRFTIEITGRGPFRAEAYAPGYATFRAPDVDPTKPLSILLRRGGESISGVVRDGTTREPLEGAMVETRVGEASTWIYEEPRLGVVEAVTGERGEFRLEGLSKRTYSVSASAPGYGRTTAAYVEPGEPVEIYLFPGSGIYGRLLDEKKKPVVGAFVAADGEDRTYSPGTAQRSDAEGRFALLGLAPGRYRLAARHETLAPAIEEVELSAESDTEVELLLTEGTTLAGRLTDEEQMPVTGKVSLRGLDGGMVSLMLRSSFRVDTDGEGSFSIGPLPAGEHTLLVESRGYAPVNIDATVTGREANQDLGDVVLEKGLAVSGRVIAEGGEPLAGALVNAVQPGRGALSASGDLFATGETDEQGRFVLAGLSLGGHRVHAVAPGYCRSETVLTEPGASDIILILKLAGSIRGTVVDPEGHPVPWFRVMARSTESRGFPAVFPDAEGEFVIDSVAEGEYAVEILTRDFVPETVPSVRVSPGAVVELGTIRLKRGGSVTGTVVDSSADPVPGATVEVIDPGMRNYRILENEVFSDRFGRFQVRGLADGKVIVVARHPSFAASRPEEVEVDSSAGATRVELVLRRGGTLEGFVRTRDGTDVAGRRIQVFDRDYSEYGAGRTLDDGSFRIEHLPEGRLIASVLHTEGDMTSSVQSLEVEIVEGETRYVEFQPRRVLVQGRVTRGGTALPGVEIELTPSGFSSTMYGGMADGPPTAGPRLLMGLSGEDGYYELIVGEPGEYQLSASAHGVGLPWKTVTVPDVEAFTMDLDFGSVRVSGRVVDKETESPIADANVVANSTTPSGFSAGLPTGADGSFELELEPGEFTLSVRADGYGRLVEKILVGEGGRADLVLALSPGFGIKGRVVDRSGRGVEQLRVIAIEDSPDIATPPAFTGVARTIPDGAFELEDLGPGRYNLLVGSESVGFAYALSVPAGARDQQLVLRPFGEVEVLVVDENETPVNSAIVALAAINGRKVRGIQSTTDANGRLALPVPLGNVTIKSALLNGPEGMSTVAVSENEAARVRIVLAQTASNRNRR